MDYKEIVKMLNWMARNSKLSGTDARVLMLMATESNYKTGEYSASYGEISEALKISKKAALVSIERLEHAKAIHKIDDACGKRSAIYKLRNMEALALIHEDEGVNNKKIEWNRERERLFGKFEDWAYEPAEGCQDCYANDSDSPCEYHQQEINKRLDSPQGRELKLWEMDNPEPQFRIKKVKFIDFKDMK